MGNLDKIKLKKQLEAKLTPEFAHQLLADMPVGDCDIYYDLGFNKFLKQNIHGRTTAWSNTLQNWIMWLHGHDNYDVQWTMHTIQEFARKYKYQLNDRVVYCGLNNDDESLIYNVVGFDPSGKVILNHGEHYGVFFMDRWRLATKAEIQAGKRLYIGLKQP